jgi:hypothetical protein
VDRDGSVVAAVWRWWRRSCGEALLVLVAYVPHWLAETLVDGSVLLAASAVTIALYYFFYFELFLAIIVVGGFVAVCFAIDLWLRFGNSKFLPTLKRALASASSGRPKRKEASVYEEFYLEEKQGEEGNDENGPVETEPSQVFLDGRGLPSHVLSQEASRPQGKTALSLGVGGFRGRPATEEDFAALVKQEAVRKPPASGPGAVHSEPASAPAEERLLDWNTPGRDFLDGVTRPRPRLKPTPTLSSKIGTALAWGGNLARSNSKRTFPPISDSVPDSELSTEHLQHREGKYHPTGSTASRTVTGIANGIAEATESPREIEEGVQIFLHDESHSSPFPTLGQVNSWSVGRDGSTDLEVDRDRDGLGQLPVPVVAPIREWRGASKGKSKRGRGPRAMEGPGPGPKAVSALVAALSSSAPPDALPPSSSGPDVQHDSHTRSSRPSSANPSLKASRDGEERERLQDHPDDLAGIRTEGSPGRAAAAAAAAAGEGISNHAAPTLVHSTSNEMPVFDILALAEDDGDARSLRSLRSRRRRRNAPSAEGEDEEVGDNHPMQRRQLHSSVAGSGGGGGGGGSVASGGAASAVSATSIRRRSLQSARSRRASSALGNVGRAPGIAVEEEVSRQQSPPRPSTVAEAEEGPSPLPSPAVGQALPPPAVRPGSELDFDTDPERE